MDWMKWVVLGILLLLGTKSVTVGSGFDFTFWYRFRKFYREWYFHKREPETFKEYITRVGYKED